MTKAGDRVMTNKQSDEYKTLYALYILDRLLERVTDPEARKEIIAEKKALSATLENPLST